MPRWDGWRTGSGYECTSGGWARMSATSRARARSGCATRWRSGDTRSRSRSRGGPRDGLWLNRLPYTKTFQLPAGWPSAMAQGEGASLLARLYLETGEERWADAARRAVAAMRAAERRGRRAGAASTGAPWPEEYPTDPPSYVLNGGIFALWGLYDVGTALGDDADRARVPAGSRHAGGEPPPLGHRLLVALRPVPAPRHERRELLLPRAAHEPARVHAGDRPAARSSRRLRRASPRYADRRLNARPRIRAQGAVPARGPAQRADRPAACGGCARAARIRRT